MVNPYTKENPGNFANDPERASKAGHKGEQMSSGKFQPGSQRAREAGHKGGTATSERYLSEARGQNKPGGGKSGGRAK